MIEKIRDKLKLDPTDEQLKNKYLQDFKLIILGLFPEGNNCDICFGRGYTSYNSETRQMVVCDCVNRAAQKRVIKRVIENAKKAESN